MNLGHEWVAVALSTARPDLTLPALGLVRTSTLFGILRTEHGLSARGATHALELALLVAGYESHSVIVAGADALDIIDTAC